MVYEIRREGVGYPLIALLKPIHPEYSLLMSNSLSSEYMTDKSNNIMADLQNNAMLS